MRSGRQRRKELDAKRASKAARVKRLAAEGQAYKLAESIASGLAVDRSIRAMAFDGRD
jgi:hypothetical protein